VAGETPALFKFAIGKMPTFESKRGFNRFNKLLLGCFRDLNSTVT